MIAGVLFAGVIFGCIGSGAFIYGKKRGSGRHMVMGAILMGYPYLIGDVWLLYGIGIALTIALFYV
jgi:hypothetical protein